MLISDGEDHDAEAVNTAKELAEQGMMISAVGIGSPDGSYIPDAITGQNKVDPATGRAIISKLNEKIDKKIDEKIDENINKNINENINEMNQELFNLKIFSENIKF